MTPHPHPQPELSPAPRIPEGVPVISKGEGRGREQSSGETQDLRYSPARGREGPRRRLPILASAASSQPLTSAPATSRDKSESRQSRGDFPAPRGGRRLS